jgi:hypothetical protein
MLLVFIDAQIGDLSFERERCILKLYFILIVRGLVDTLRSSPAIPRHGANQTNK